MYIERTLRRFNAISSVFIHGISWPAAFSKCCRRAGGGFCAALCGMAIKAGGVLLDWHAFRMYASSPAYREALGRHASI